MSKPRADQTQPEPQGYRATLSGEPKNTPWNAYASSKLCNSEIQHPYGVEGSVSGIRLTDKFVEAITPVWESAA